MKAPRRDISGRDISTMASSWAWAHGPGGAITMAGAAIASVAMAEDAITVESAAPLMADVQAAGKLAVAAEPV